jgi:tRNA1(Val) A37 N6-methylase TrmN6
LRKNVARQELSLSLFDLMQSAQAYSHSESVLALAFPFDRVEELRKVGEGLGWYLRREMRLVSKPGKRCERVLAQFERSYGELDSKTLCIEDAKGQYSHEFKKMTSIFYLKF